MTLLHWLVTATPSPEPIDDKLVTPGWIGFVFIFAIAIITVLLIIDMTRRIRRVRYRGEIRDRIAAEEADGARPPTDQP